MTTQKLPIGTDVYRNVDEEGLNQIQARIVDGLIEELDDGGRATIRRPGMGSSLLQLNPTVSPTFAVAGLYWWDFTKQLVAITGSNIFLLQYLSGILSVYDSIDTSGQFSINNNKQVIFASEGSRIVAANGGFLWTFGTTPSLSGSLGVLNPAIITNAPTDATHVGWLDGYYLANEIGTNTFKWCNRTDYATWDAANIASAEGRGDNIVALHVFNRAIFLFGSESLELWENVGVTPFARLPNGFIDVGCGAPYSIVNAGNGLYWMSDRRQFVTLTGGETKPVSTPYDKEIEGFERVDDCQGNRIDIQGKKLIVWNFPTAKRTLVFNTTSNTWTEFGHWLSDFGKYEEWQVLSHAFCPDWGLHLVGHKFLPPRLFSLSLNNYNDNADRIRMSALTGWIDHGTSQKKRNKELRVRIKSGTGVTYTGFEANSAGTAKPGHFMIRFRDDGSVEWKNERLVNIGAQGKTTFLKKLFALGSYESRQYEFFATEQVPIMFVNAEEDFDVIG